MAECPSSIEELQELEKLIPLCRVTLYNQAKARIETGAAKSVSEAARQLADETGRSVNTIRSAINRESGTDALHQLSELSGTDKHRPYASSAKDEPEPEYTQPVKNVYDDDEVIAIQKQEADEQFKPEIEEESVGVNDEYINFNDIHESHTEVAAAIIGKQNHRSLGTGENEWYTPTEYINAAKMVLGDIDLDPASSDHAQKTISAKNYYTIDDDGLSKDWFGSVWLNPPYTQPDIKNFIQKLVNEFKAKNIKEAIALTHNYTDTSWFHLAASACSSICFTKGRISFVNPDGKKASPTQGQAFFYFGNNQNMFSRIFGQYGMILSRNE